jgi:methylenetetrahydrofolate reductase (NADPH)
MPEGATLDHPYDLKVFHVEILTPKLDAPDIEGELTKFGDKYRASIGAGYVVCITDNPMGHLSVTAMDAIQELGLPVHPDRLCVHLNTFHTKKDLDAILRAVHDAGGRDLLIVSGDGSQRLHRLEPDEIGVPCLTVTSVELLRYIDREYPGLFRCGVAFNPYEPQDAELAKMERKVDAGARFIITQPILGRDERVIALRRLGLPAIIDAWMSKKLHLLGECVGTPIPEGTPYDPIQNLKDLRTFFPDFGLYLALLGFKTQFPILGSLWT